MSADNGVYIIKTKRNRVEDPKGCWSEHKTNYVYRVSHVQAIDNIGWYRDNQLYNLGAYLHYVFGNSEVYHTEEEALLRAKEILKYVLYAEYGISTIDLSEFVFFGDM